MNIRLNPPNRRKLGLTLLEIMVAVALLVLIMGGLMAMFNQTQRVFMTGLRQVDVLEGGRAAMDVITRDLEQMVAGHRPWDTNFHASLRSYSVTPAQLLGPDNARVQLLTLQEVYCLNRTTDWQAVGYKVLEVDPLSTNTMRFNVLLGSLYRFSTNNNQLHSTNFLARFRDNVSEYALMTNGHLSRVIDGVVHFKILAFDADGRRHTNNSVVIANPYVEDPVVSSRQPPAVPFYAFKGDALPAYLEVELGVLEPEAVIRARAVPKPNAAAYEANLRRFIEDNSGKIHFFRQRIPIRVAARPGS